MAILGKKLPIQLSSSAVPAQADPQVISFVPHPGPFQGLQPQGPVVSTAAKIQITSLWQPHLGILLYFSSLVPLAAPVSQGQTLIKYSSHTGKLSVA